MASLAAPFREVKFTFSDGAAGVVNITDALWGPVFEPLKDMERFKRLGVSDVLHTLAWEDGPDLAPEYLRENWPSRPEKWLAPMNDASGEGQYAGMTPTPSRIWVGGGDTKDRLRPHFPAAVIFGSPRA